MKFKIETIPDAFVIRSNVALEALRSEYKDKVIQWHLQEQVDAYIYALSKQELQHFFAGEQFVTASVVYDHDGDVVMLSVTDVDMSFGTNLACSVGDDVITAYVSLKSTIRIGWNWFGATEALVTHREIERYQMTAEGLVLEAKVRTRFFKPVAVNVVAVGTLLDEPVTCTSVVLNGTLTVDGEYETHVRFVMPIDAITTMHAKMRPHEMGQKTFEFKFGLQINEYRLTKQTVKFTADKALVLREPLLRVAAANHQDQVLATRVSGAENVMFILAVLDQGAYDGVREQLLATQYDLEPTKLVLLDQGEQHDRENLRLLFKALIKAGRTDVYLLTDGQFMPSWSSEEVMRLIYANSKEHVWIYPQIKTLICMGNRHDAFPLGAQSMLPIVIKHHVALIDNLKRQMTERGFNLPNHGTVDFMIANKQTKHLLKQVYARQMTIHMTGLPAFDVLEAENPVTVSDRIGVFVTDETYDALQPLVGNTQLMRIAATDNLRQCRVIITDHESMATAASVLGVPIVYLKQDLTAEEVDHFYYLAGPVIRDVMTGTHLLKKVLDDVFDFKPYIDHAEHNLNAHHDAKATERILDIL